MKCSEKLTLLADGCFWHGHDCQNAPIQIIKIIGKENVTVILNTTKKLLACLNRMGESYCVYVV